MILTLLFLLLAKCVHHYKTGTDHEKGSVEEQNQQLQQIIFDVVVSLLQAQDARWEEWFIFV